MIIDGRGEANKIKEKIKNTILEKRYNLNLTVVNVGSNPASLIYINNKKKACESVGIKSDIILLPENTCQNDLNLTIETLSKDKNVNGIILQLPLPKHLNEREALLYLSPNKDVDGLTIENIGKLSINQDSFIPCTPKGILFLLKLIKTNLSGLHAVIVGRSNLVGKPMGQLLLNENCTVTICHSKTKNLKSYTKTADILIVAIGNPKYIKKEYVKNGAIVIDVGINRTENGIVGDVDFDNVKDVASFITPVPKGVGPMTVAMLLENTLKTAILQD